ncbi:MAG: DctP family TRAP transporter solute-binding subunit [Bacillota bacterium]
MLKKVLVLSLVLIFSLSFFSVVDAQYKDEYSLTYNVSPAMPWGITVEYFSDLITERTDGRININAVGGSSLAGGQQTEIFSMVRRGAIDMAVESTINFSPQIPAMNIFSLPFFFSGYDDIDAVTEGQAGQMIIDRMEELGVVAVGWGENGFRQITNDTRPIHEPEDLSDLRFRVVGSEIFIETFQALGSNPLTMNWGEATTGFQQGTVDGQENPVVGVLIPVKIWDFHEYLTLWDYVADPLVFAVNQQVFNNFSEEDQQTLLETAQEAQEFGKMLARYGLDDGEAKEFIDAKIESGDDLGYAESFLDNIRLEDGSIDPIAYMEEQGMQVNQLTDEEKEAFKELTEEVYDEWIEVIGEDVYEAALEDMNR